MENQHSQAPKIVYQSKPHPSAQGRPIEPDAKERKRDAAQGSMIHRRSFLAGLATSIVAAPAIVRAASIMPVRAIEPIEMRWLGYDGLYGRSPAMEALDEMRKHDEAIQQMLKVWRAPIAAQWDEYAGYDE